MAQPRRSSKIHPQRADAASPEGVAAPLPGGSAEMTLHELGESLVAASIGMQRELRRYAPANGAFVLEEFEIDLPARLRVDSLGQVIAQLVSDVPANTAVARLHMRIAPDSNAGDSAIPIVADQSLALLGVLSSRRLAMLAAQRVYSAEDLIRAARNPARRSAFERVIPADVLDIALARAALLVVPVFPPGVGQALVATQVRSVDDFLQRDPDALAVALGKAMAQEITGKQVRGWQDAVVTLQKLPDPPAQASADAARVGEATRHARAKR